jgi:hypothetical protein
MYAPRRVGNAAITAVMQLPTLHFLSTKMWEIKTANGSQPDIGCPGGQTIAEKESLLGNCARKHAMTVFIDRGCDAGVGGIRL